MLRSSAAVRRTLLPLHTGISPAVTLTSPVTLASPVTHQVPRRFFLSKSSSGEPLPREALDALRAAYPIRNDWTLEQVSRIFNKPLLELCYEAATVHRLYHDSRQVQQCTLLSIKTGGCPENCSYCPQSSRYKTSVKAEKLMSVQEVIEVAATAKRAGSTRFCMGAAWREVTGKWQFNQVLEMVRQVRNMDMEVCCTLGMITPEHAKALKEAGLTAYNHNLDSSKEFYPNIITTRTYDNRLETLKNVREAGINVCCGGIVGLGESVDDRIKLLHTLSTLPTHPESVPVNALVPVEGTPLEKQPRVPIWDMLRMISTARIVMPRSMVRLSAGRISMSLPEQAMCFFSGANSIFTGDKLLTTPNNAKNEDSILFELLGLEGKPPTYEDVQEPKFETQASAPTGSCGTGGCGRGGCQSKKPESQQAL